MLMMKNKLKTVKEKIKNFFISEDEEALKQWANLDFKGKIKIISAYLKKRKSFCICSGFVICVLAVAGVLNLNGSVGVFDFNDRNDVNAKETTVESSYSSTSTTSEVYTESTTMGQVQCHYNSDGKLYGKKGTFSGIWPNLEKVAKASNEQYIKDLMVYVGDNTELEKSKYEEDKFTKINGYGTVHWRQSGHKWPNKYSCLYNGESSSNSDSLFKKIKKEEKIENVTEVSTEHIEQEGVIATMAEMVLSDSAVDIEKSTETTTKAEEKPEKNNTAKENNQKEKTSELVRVNAVTSAGIAPGKVWAGNACGVCSLAMALSTLSGVTVSPPEVAIAANLLIGESAWYQVILYSKSQAKLAQLAGYPVYMEPWNEAKKSTMDACLNANGVALFVSKRPEWVDYGGRHYIMVRNKVGDKYYTADSGKNPTGGYTYEELSDGYCQQYIVYIYPKTVK